jgi:hypothetical protein
MHSKSIDNLRREMDYAMLRIALDLAFMRIRLALIDCARPKASLSTRTNPKRP